MSRLKDFLIWIIIIIAFYIFSNGLIYLCFHGEELGMKIYNVTHQEEVVNEVE